MIAPLRRRHRTLVLSLAALLPVPVALALVDREPMPAAERVSALELSEGFDRLLPIEDGPAPMAIRLGSGVAFGGTAEDTYLRVEPLAPSTSPALLFYASDSAATEGGGLPAGARLLGPWGTVSEPTRVDAPYLVVFSLGHGQVVRSIALD